MNNGIVENYTGGTVTYNNGAVYNYGGKVTGGTDGDSTEYGKGTEYFSVVTITPTSGYEIAELNIPTEWREK